MGAAGMGGWKIAKRRGMLATGRPRTSTSKEGGGELGRISKGGGVSLK